MGVRNTPHLILHCGNLKGKRGMTHAMKYGVDVISNLAPKQKGRRQSGDVWAGDNGVSQV